MAKTSPTADASLDTDRQPDIQHFDGSVAKITADGKRVLSDHVDRAAGEKLQSEVTSGDRYKLKSTATPSEAPAKGKK